MFRVSGIVGAALLALAGLAAAYWYPAAGDPEAATRPAALVAAKAAKPGPPPVPQPPPIAEVLRSGVLIVISKGSQRMFVFKDGAVWDTSPVSTGRRGHATPSGVFPILQKARYHRSNIYSGAPMPYMQRLTWSGIAIHAGYLPGYPASHGCIRLPAAFAKSLYDLTRIEATTVVITNVKLASDTAAKTLALGIAMPKPPAPMQPQPAASPSPTASPHIEPLPLDLPPAGGQTIQLAAAATPDEAQAHWSQLVAAHPELRQYQMSVIPAVVGSRRVYRLRATAPGAHAYCAALKRAGEACFNVN